MQARNEGRIYFKEAAIMEDDDLLSYRGTTTFDVM